MQVEVQNKVRIIVGPNGSGKSTLFNLLENEFNLDIGVFINADEILKQAKLTGLINFPITLKNRFPQYEIDSFISNHTLTKRFKKTFKCSIINNQIKINKATFNSYNAAIIADFYRIILLVSKINFSYESVFSDASKINSVKQLKKNDHQIYSYIVSTLNPEINKSRVKHRVANAGHSVPENKIEERYYKSLINIKKVIPFSHRAFIIDNSQQYEPVLITEVFEGKTIKYLNQHYQPNWLKNLIKL